MHHQTSAVQIIHFFIEKSHINPNFIQILISQLIKINKVYAHDKGWELFDRPWHNIPSSIQDHMPKVGSKFRKALLKIVENWQKCFFKFRQSANINCKRLKRATFFSNATTTI